MVNTLYPHPPKLKKLRDISMAILGIDGNMWYVSCGGCLGDPTSSFVFAETPRKCFDEWNRKNPAKADAAYKHMSYMDMTVAEYNATNAMNNR